MNYLKFFTSLFMILSLFLMDRIAVVDSLTQNSRKFRDSMDKYHLNEESMAHHVYNSAHDNLKWSKKSFYRKPINPNFRRINDNIQDLPMPSHTVSRNYNNHLNSLSLHQLGRTSPQENIFQPRPQVINYKFDSSAKVKNDKLHLNKYPRVNFIDDVEKPNRKIRHHHGEKRRQFF